LCTYKKGIMRNLSGQMKIAQAYISLRADNLLSTGNCETGQGIARSKKDECLSLGLIESSSKSKKK